MKRSWGRLGAAVSAVALLAGGFVGVAAPAQALDLPPDACWEFEDEGATGWAYCSMPNSFETAAGAEAAWDTLCAAAYETIPFEDGWLPNPVKDPHVWEFGSGRLPWGASCSYYPTKGLLDGPVDGDDGPVVGDDGSGGEPVQKNPPPPPCWSGEAGNNCPVGGALRFAAPRYAMVGVPVTMYAYATWRPDANSPAQPTNGTAVIRVDGEDYSGVEFIDGVAQWRFIPETEGMKEFTASGVVFSGLSGAASYIDSVPARTYVLEYDPEAYEEALKKKRVEVGDTYVITDPNQARSYLEDRYAWSVSDKSDDVCAVYETKKGAVKAKFNGEGKCTVIWMDKESEEEGKYTFIAKK